jgi:threonylcarbamoyladenosine tRNA methylthiotransferase MtaB
MPPLARTVVKERARRLREKGAAALVQHLEGEVGARRRVLMESDNIGRTEQFTQVHVAAQAGAMIDTVITGHDGRQLLGG